MMRAAGRIVQYGMDSGKKVSEIAKAHITTTRVSVARQDQRFEVVV